MSRLAIDRLHNILVIAPNWIGDTLLATPFIAALRRALPWAKLTALANVRVAPILERNPHLDTIISYQRARGLSDIPILYTLIKQLQKRQFDLAILLPNSFVSALLAFLIRPKWRVGYKKDGRSLLLTHPLPSLRQHQVDSYLGLLKGLGIEAKGEEFTLSLSPEEKIFAGRVWEEHQLTHLTPVIGLNPGADFFPSKMWPSERFAKLADRLIEELGAKVVIFGSRDALSVAEKILSLTAHPVISMVGKDTLRLFAAMVARCDLLITGDTGPMHIASAVKTPVVALFGPTDPEFTAPCGVNNVVIEKELFCSPCFQRRCPRDYHECMDLITVEEVFQAARNLLT